MTTTPTCFLQTEWPVILTLYQHPEGMTSWQLCKTASVHEKTAQRILRRMHPFFLNAQDMTSKQGRIYQLKEEARKLVEHYFIESKGEEDEKNQSGNIISH